MSKNNAWSRATLIALCLSGAALVPQDASARYVGLQCGADVGVDVYTDSKYLVMRPSGEKPALLLRNVVISDDIFQGESTSKDGPGMVVAIDRKTGLLFVTIGGILKGADRCMIRTAGASATPPPDAAPTAPAGNKF